MNHYIDSSLWWELGRSPAGSWVEQILQSVPRATEVFRATTGNSRTGCEGVCVTCVRGVASFGCSASAGFFNMANLLIMFLLSARVRTSMLSKNSLCVQHTHQMIKEKAAALPLV